MAFERPVYLMRAGGATLAAVSLAELCELIECAHDARDAIELVHAYYGASPSLDLPELDRIVELLASS